jgi:hypothetical protein
MLSYMLVLHGSDHSTSEKENMDQAAIKDIKRMIEKTGWDGEDEN